jgi:hypothetical protein
MDLLLTFSGRDGASPLTPGQVAASVKIAVPTPRLQTRNTDPRTRIHHSFTTADPAYQTTAVEIGILRFARVGEWRIGPFVMREE